MRGHVALPTQLQPLHIIGAPGSTLVATVQQQLESANIDVTDTLSEARYVLSISNEAHDRRTLSVGNDNRAAEYQLIESAQIELRAKDDVVLIEPTTLSERRILRYNADNVLSSRSEEQLLRREMQQNLASKLLRQLGAVTPPAP